MCQWQILALLSTHARAISILKFVLRIASLLKRRHKGPAVSVEQDIRWRQSDDGAQSLNNIAADGYSTLSGQGIESLRSALSLVQGFHGEDHGAILRIASGDECGGYCPRYCTVSYQTLQPLRSDLSDLGCNPICLGNVYISKCSIFLIKIK